MISHRYQCIFIHIPKCAGTSIERVLGHLDDYQGRGGQDHRTVRMIERPYFTPGSLCSTENIYELMRRARHRVARSNNNLNKLRVTRVEYNRYFKFAIVRNPWARVHSWYKASLEDPYYKDIRGKNGVLSLKDFLRIRAGHGIMRPQMHWIRGFDGLINLDYIGRFENLTESFRHICKSLGIDGVALPHELMGPNIDYRDHYDAESIRLIADMERDVIRMFDYSF